MKFHLLILLSVISPVVWGGCPPDCPTSADYQALTAAINNLSDTMRYVVDEVFTFDPVFFDFLYEQAILFLIAGMSVGLLLFVIRKVRHG